MDDLAVERVLRAVERIPPGQAAAYSDIGRAVGASARFVARVLSRLGSTVSWWRVPTVQGTLPPALTAKALPLWEDEGMPLLGDRIDMSRARIDAVTFQRAVRDSLAGLPSDDEPAPRA